MKTRLILLLSTFAWPGGAATCTEHMSYFRQHGGVAVNDEHPVPDQLDNRQYWVWRQPLDTGHSTPCISEKLIFLTAHKGNTLSTLALDRATGELQWERSIQVAEFERYHRASSPASCTPACDAERVYVYFGSYGMVCYDFQGNQLWEHRLGPFQDEFGANSSPVLAGELVILNQDHDVDCFLLALDRKTGQVAWRIARDGFTRSYSTPVIRTVDGTPQVIVAGSRQLVAYDVSNGDKLWWVRGLARVVIPTPSQTEKMLYVVSWTDGADPGLIYSMEPWPDAGKQYDANDDAAISRDEAPQTVRSRFFRMDTDQNGLLNQSEWEAYARVFSESKNAIQAIDPGGRGDVTNSHVKWKYERSLPYVASPLVYRDVLYMVKDGGIVTSLQLDTGEVVKQGRARGRGNYYASPVAADGKVFVASEAGVITVLAASPRWEILNSCDFGERILATPVIRDGVIYLRTEKALYRLQQ